MSLLHWCYIALVTACAIYLHGSVEQIIFDSSKGPSYPYIGRLGQSITIFIQSKSDKSSNHCISEVENSTICKKNALIYAIIAFTEENFYRKTPYLMVKNYSRFILHYSRSIGWVDGKIYRTTPYLMGNHMS